MLFLSEPLYEQNFNAYGSIFNILHRCKSPNFENYIFWSYCLNKFREKKMQYHV